MSHCPVITPYAALPGWVLPVNANARLGAPCERDACHRRSETHSVVFSPSRTPFSRSFRRFFSAEKKDSRESDRSQMRLLPAYHHTIIPPCHRAIMLCDAKPIPRRSRDVIFIFEVITRWNYPKTRPNCSDRAYAHSYSFLFPILKEREQKIDSSGSPEVSDAEKYAHA